MRSYQEYNLKRTESYQLVSICVPVYNGERYLLECLNSIAAQTYKDFVAIVVDNCSYDDTKYICERFIDDRFFYIRNEENIGSLGNHNRCLDLAHTKYIKILSSDDVLLPTVLEAQVAALEEHPDVGIATCDCIVTDESLNPISVTNYITGKKKGTLVIDLCCAQIENLVGGPSNTLLRREAVSDIRFDLKRKWMGDLILHCNILKSWNYINIGYPGFYYRRHMASDSLVSCSPIIRREDESYFVRCFARSPVGLLRLYIRKLRQTVAAAYLNIKTIGWFVDLFTRRPISLLRQTWLRARWAARGVSVAPTAQFLTGSGCKIQLQPGVLVATGCIMIATQQEKILEGSSLIIGEGTAVNEYCNLRAAGGDIRIGKRCMFAQFITVVATNHAKTLGTPMIDQAWDLSRRGVKIGDDVWVGANAVILPGVTISDGAVIAAGAVVNSDVPTNEIWGGVPARRISMRQT